MNETVPQPVYREPGVKRKLPTLDTLRIASPCAVPWDEMLGNGRVRHCGKCDKDVYNLDRMNRADAEALLRERVTEPCVRFYRRSDGTILTADCPIGAHARVRAMALTGAVFTAVMGVLALVGLVNPSRCTTQVGSASTGGWGQ